MLKKLFLVLLLFFLINCHHSPTTPKTIKVKTSDNTQTLYYSGTIEPILAYTIQNINADGIIAEKYFEYGTHVDKGQILFLITSNQLSINYQTALTAYVKAKKNLSDIRYQVEGEKELSKLKIVSTQEYMASETQLFNAELDYDQAIKALYDIMEMAGIPKSQLSHLKSTDADAVTKALLNVPNKVKIISPITGVALFPKSTTGADNNDLKVGSAVKANGTLVLIHNKQGISVTIKVNQLDISQIRYDEKALITSDAFPGVTLKANITRIDREAMTPEFGGSLPTFNVQVTVPELTPKEYNAIRMGMSAEVAIQIKTSKAIMIPISAVITEDTQSFVYIINPETLQTTKTPVQTGATNQDSVEILSGLKNGDEVIADATSH